MKTLAKSLPRVSDSSHLTMAPTSSTVQRARIAQAQLGDGSRFPEIVKLNKELIKNPDMILIGWELKLP